MILLQCIKSARWPTDHPLSIFPGIQVSSSTNTKHLPSTLTELVQLPHSAIQSIPSKLSLSNSQRSAFLKAALALPNIKVDIPQVTALSITVSLHRINPVTERDGRVYAPRFPKSQNEGWFVIVADSARDEILAIKRVGWTTPGRDSTQGVRIGSTPNAKSVIKLPPAQGVLGTGSVGGKERKVDVLVVSDAYIGMVYKVVGVEIPAVPMLVDDGKKDKDLQGAIDN